VTIYGSGFGNQITQAGALPLPTTLGGITVQFNNILCPLIYVSPAQINLQVPYEVQPGTAAVIISRSDGGSAKSEVKIASVAPGFFGSNGYGLFLNNGTVINSAQTPATPGTIMVGYGTGIGPTNPPGTTGSPAPNPAPSATSSVSATVGGAPADVVFSGLTSGSVGLCR
jgi:uncharacterized protein (TIGR03437 family)